MTRSAYLGWTLMILLVGGLATAGPVANVAALHMDEGEGTWAYNAVPVGLDGRLNGGASWTAGKVGGGVQLDGVDDHLRIASTPTVNPTSGLTVEGWFHLDTNPDVDGQNNWRWLFNKGGWASPFDCILEQSRQLNFSIKLDGDPNHYRWWAPHSLPLDQWAHAAWTYDGPTGTMKVYLNGSEATHSIGTTGDLATNTADVFVSWPSGSATPGGNGAFPGRVDEFAIYDRVLSATEIAERYNSGVGLPVEPGTAPPPAEILALHLDEADGPVVIDAVSPDRAASLKRGASHTADAVFGNAVHLDGVDDHLRMPMPAADSPTSGLTVEGWFLVDSDPNVDGNNNWRWLFNKGGWGSPFDCILEQNRQLCFSLKLDGDPTHYRWWTGQYLPLDEWAHAAWTYDAATGMMQVYVNGEPASHSIGTTGNLATNSSDFFISWPSVAAPNGNGAFPGTIDEFAVYGRALSGAEIYSRYTDGPPQPALVLPPNPPADVVILHLNEGAGTIAHDATAPRNDGTVLNGAAWSDGAYGTALHFDGVDDHVRVPLPASQSPTGGLTVEGWFLVDQDPNVDGNNNWRWVFNKGEWASPFDCILEQSRQLNFSIRVDGEHKRFWTGHYLPLGEWAHMAFTYDADTGMMRAYLDGVEHSFYIGTIGDLDTNDLDLFLSWPSGTAAPNGWGAFPGLIDEFAVYSYPLTQAQVLARIANGPPIYPEPGTLALLLGGLAALAARRRRKL